MFEKASRVKLRFPFRGAISVEDLWDLSVTDLDLIYKGLNSKLRVSQEDSLLEKKTAEDEILALQISIIKHVVETKVKEAEYRKSLAEKRAKKQKLLEILKNKENESFEQMSKEDLQKMINELE